MVSKSQFPYFSHLYILFLFRDRKHGREGLKLALIGQYLKTTLSEPSSRFLILDLDDPVSEGERHQNLLDAN